MQPCLAFPVDGEIMLSGPCKKHLAAYVTLYMTLKVQTDNGLKVHLYMVDDWGFLPDHLLGTPCSYDYGGLRPSQGTLPQTFRLKA